MFTYIRMAFPAQVLNKQLLPAKKPKKNQGSKIRVPRPCRQSRSKKKCGGTRVEFLVKSGGYGLQLFLITKQLAGKPDSGSIQRVFFFFAGLPSPLAGSPSPLAGSPSPRSVGQGGETGFQPQKLKSEMDDFSINNIPLINSKRYTISLFKNSTCGFQRPKFPSLKRDVSINNKASLLIET